MTTLTPPLTWSAVFTVAPKSTKALRGDKILLPQSALEQLLAIATVTGPSTIRATDAHFDPFNPYSLAAARAEQSQWRETQQQLPHPLTFRLVNTQTGNVVYAGIQEFSAAEGEVSLSAFLLDALGIVEPTRESTPASKDSSDSDISDVARNFSKDDSTASIQITVHAKELPKGTYVRLRPLEAGYNPEDWKSLLERQLRENFTTLTTGQILSVRGSKTEDFRFLIDKVFPEGDGICVVDTDLEVDIEALNEEQARETLKQIMEKAQKAPGTSQGSSAGGEIDIWKPVVGQVLVGDYVDYQLPSWDRSQAIEIVLTNEDEKPIDLFISPQSPHQRARPRDDEHVLSDFSNQPVKKIVLQPSNVELEDAEELSISVHAVKTSEQEMSGPHHFSLRIRLISSERASDDPMEVDQGTEPHGPDEEQCKNCQQWVPKQTMMLHENFCLRNNIVCPQCKNVFQRKSQAWQSHWHCTHDTEFGNTAER